MGESLAESVEKVHAHHTTECPGHALVGVEGSGRMCQVVEIGERFIFGLFFFSRGEVRMRVCLE